MTEVTTIFTGGNWRPLAAVAGVVGALLAGALVLWAHYGTAVFFEMIAAGIAMCF